MNRDEVWQQLKDEKETIYGKKMLEVFLMVTDDLSIKHLEEALDSGYDVNDEVIIKKISGHMIDSELLDKILLKKKDMGHKLMRRILGYYSFDEMKEIAKKMNINKLTIDDVYNLAWLKVENIEGLYEIFGDKLKQFDIKQIFGLIGEGVTWKIENFIDRIVNAIGGWKSLVDKIMKDIDDLFHYQEIPAHLLPNYYLSLKIKLNDSGLNKYFAEKIIETDKKAELVAKFFGPKLVPGWSRSLPSPLYPKVEHETR